VVSRITSQLRKASPSSPCLLTTSSEASPVGRLSLKPLERIAVREDSPERLRAVLVLLLLGVDAVQRDAVAGDEGAEVEVARLGLREEDLAEEVQAVGRSSNSDEDQILGCDALAGWGQGRWWLGGRTHRRSW